MKVTKGQVAQVCHGAHKAYNESIGDFSTPKWGELPDEEKHARVAVVDTIQASPGITPEKVHNMWLERRKKQGWRRVEDEVTEVIDGKEAKKKVPKQKNPVRKYNPKVVPYDELSPEDQFKNKILIGVCGVFYPPQEKKVDLKEGKPKREEKKAEKK